MAWSSSRSQLADLAWLGISWDAGPDREDGRGPYRQSERGSIYEGLYEKLEREGHSYPCYCTPLELDVARRAQLAAGQPPRYPGTCRDLDAAARAARAAEGRQPALRFRVPQSRVVEFEDLVRGPQSIAAATLGDFVVRRADGGPMFFFCNAVDDALMGVTQVLRGDDHLSNTPRQLLLLEALGLPAPRYGHLPLLRGCERRAAVQAPRQRHRRRIARARLSAGRRSATTCCGSGIRARRIRGWNPPNSRSISGSTAWGGRQRTSTRPSSITGSARPSCA